MKFLNRRNILVYLVCSLFVFSVKLIAAENQSMKVVLPSIILSLLDDVNPVNAISLNPPIETFSQGTFRFSLQGTPENDDGVRRDFVAQGLEYFYTPLNSNLSFRFSEDQRELVVSIIGFGLVDSPQTQTEADRWSLTLEAGAGVLEPGLYENASGAFFNTGNRLSFGGNGRGCNTSNGEFRIVEFELSDGEISKLVMDFIQTCGSFANTNSPLRGSIYFDASNTPAIFEEPPLLSSVPSPSVTAPIFSGASVVIESVNVIAIGRTELIRFDESNSTVRFARPRIGSNGRELNFLIDSNEFGSYFIDFARSSFDSDPDRNAPLSVGLYSNSFGSPAAEFDISGFGARCVPSSSQFRIYNIDFNSDGDLDRLLADFAISCRNSTETDGEIRGSINYDNTIEF